MSSKAVFSTLCGSSAINGDANTNLPLHPCQYDILAYQVKNICSCRSLLQCTAKEILTYDSTPLMISRKEIISWALLLISCFSEIFVELNVEILRNARNLTRNYVDCQGIFLICLRALSLIPEPTAIYKAANIMLSASECGFSSLPKTGQYCKFVLSQFGVFRFQVKFLQPFWVDF